MLKGKNLYKKILSYFITLVCGIAIYFLLIKKWNQLSSLAITSTDNNAVGLNFDIMINTIESFIYIISTLLLYPVLIGLSFLILYLLFFLGKFVGDWINRIKNKEKRLEEFFSKNISGNNTTDIQSLFESKIKNSKYPDIEIMNAINVWKQSKIKDINYVRFIVRLAPSLGLMGTLIPMGTALASLSQGDMLAMSTNMVTAFTTTITGIACSTLAFLIVIKRENWLRKDIYDNEMYGELLLRELEEEKK